MNWNELEQLRADNHKQCGDKTWWTGFIEHQMCRRCDGGGPCRNQAMSVAVCNFANNLSITLCLECLEQLKHAKELYDEGDVEAGIDHYATWAPQEPDFNPHLTEGWESNGWNFMLDCGHFHRQLTQDIHITVDCQEHFAGYSIQAWLVVEDYTLELTPNAFMEDEKDPRDFADALRIADKTGMELEKMCAKMFGVTDLAGD